MPLVSCRAPMFPFAAATIALVAATAAVAAEGKKPDIRSAEAAVANLDIGEGLAVELFAAEPLLANPANIDIDHLGRVWVCEVLNYRKFRNKNIPAERVRDGDRILVIEDTDQDGIANTVAEFYRGPDVDSAHGICVLPTPSGKGTRAIVSCGDKVFALIDDDGDLRADRKETLFTNIQGTEHDHGIHAFVFGPDGRFYFNFGNAGREISDRDGNPIVDMAGNKVDDTRQPYQQGMVFRCEADGSRFETLGWNFRNNWEVCVDSFGTLWQSDNDDDGNRGVRINYVMEYGNFGYRDEVTGAGWSQPRTGMHDDVPKRHWHLNDPGVVPNLLQTGGGSPTGILCYEGSLLPASYQNQLVHCDAGPNVVRGYATQPAAAGYTATVLPIMKSTTDPWFRPSDACVAPDGSIIVADWYDPGVGGHAMGDVDRGRLFRVATPNLGYHAQPVDVSHVEGAIAALRNPNLATRFMAYTALREFDAQAEAKLAAVFRGDPDSRMRARALWLLARLNDRARALNHIAQAVADDDANLRITGLRAARMVCEPSGTVAATAPSRAGVRGAEETKRLAEFLRTLAEDPSPQVRREVAIALRNVDDDAKARRWATLAEQHDGDDRWYLEALGIAARGDWDACLTAWRRKAAADWKSPAGRDIVWRSRASQTPDLLAELILDPATPEAELPRYFRAYDLLRVDGRHAALKRVALNATGRGQRSAMMILESLARLEASHFTAEAERDAVTRAIGKLRSSPEFPALATRFGIESFYPAIVQTAIEHADQQRGVDAIRALLETGNVESIVAGLGTSDDASVLSLLRVLAAASDNRLDEQLLSIARDAQRSLAIRGQAISTLGASVPGAKRLAEVAEQNPFTGVLSASVASALHRSEAAEVREVAARLYPLPPAKGDKPLPSFDQLVAMEGDAARGRDVFNKTGTCATCHKIGDNGKDVGPSLAEIGSKLSREAMFQSMLFPSAGISHGFESYTLETVSGNVLTGIVRSASDQEVVLIDAKAVERTFARDQIERLTRQDVSLMPADLHKLMTPQQLVDVVDYMQSLRRAE